LKLDKNQPYLTKAFNAIFKYFWIIGRIEDYKFGMEIGRSSDA
jgi:hypothetical protein